MRNTVNLPRNSGFPLRQLVGLPTTPRIARTRTDVLAGGAHGRRLVEKSSGRMDLSVSE